MAAKVGEIYYDVTLELDQMIKDQRRVATETQKVSGTLSEMGAKVRAVAAAVGVFVAATKLLSMAKLADEVRMLAARVQVAAGSIEAGAQAMRELEAISIRTRSSIEANADVFSRLNQSILQMGGTQRDTLQLTELLGKGIAASGAKGQEAEAAMRQFGQAMGTGKLSGDELNSMMENSQYLMQKLAQGLGVPIGALKKLGADGKLTADVLLKAFEKMSAQIDEDFSKLPPTIESAAVVAKDAAARLAKAIDDVSNTSAAMTGVLKGAGSALDALAAEITGAGDASDELGRNKAISEWASTSVTAMSYLIGAADTVWQTISVLGRNVAFVFKGIGTEIGGIGAQVAAVMRGDFAGAAAIGDQMKADAAERRRELEAADAATLNRQNYGEAMRQRLEKKPETKSAPSGVQFSSLTPPADPEVQKRLDGMRDEVALLKLTGVERAKLQATQKLGSGATPGEQELAKKFAAEKYMLEQAQKKQTDLDKGGASRAKEQKAQAESYLKNLDQQAARTDQMTASQRLQYDLKTGAVVLSGQELKKAQELASTIDAAKKSEEARVIAAGLVNAELTAQRDLMVQIDSYTQNLAGMTMSDRALQDMQGRLQITEAYLGRIRSLEDQQRNALASNSDPNKEAVIRKQYDDQIAVQKEFQSKALAEFDKYVVARNTKQEDWTTGAQKAYSNYLESARNAAEQAQNLFERGFQGMEDALVKFAQTGKLDFKSLADSIIADLIRIQVRQQMVSAMGGSKGDGLFGMLMSGVTSLIGGGSTAAAAPSAYNLTSASNYSGGGLGLQLSGGRANGGGVGAGKMYEVNEDGDPELLSVGNKQLLMMAGQSGSVTPLGGMDVAKVPSPEGRGGSWAAPVINMKFINAPSQPEVKQRQGAGGSFDVEVIFKQFEDRIGDGIANGSGTPYRALKGRFGLSD